MPRIAHVRAGLAWGIVFAATLPSQERKVLVEALPMAKLHVVDAANRPLPGAVLSDALRTADRPQPAAADRATELLDQLMQKLGPRLVNGAYSDDQGLVVVRTPPRDAYMLSVLLSAPGHGGARVKLAPDSEQVAPLANGPLPRGR